ncbi:hypothetical protein CRX72_04710 [Pantoea sp. BRM17]|nr:hypothetical protein CRX72_04710 [Pantoea sp. BRM17]
MALLISISVVCSKGSTYSVGLSNGNNFSGTARQMANGASRLAYDIYKDAATTSRWGPSGSDRWSSTTSTSLSLTVSYSVCTSAGVAGICLGTVQASSGTALPLTVTLVVTNDCTTITAPNLNFGSAPLAGSFSAVQQSGGSDNVPIQLCVDSACATELRQGNSYRWNASALLALGNSLNFTIPLYFRTVPGQVIAAGTYTTTLRPLSASPASFGSQTTFSVQSQVIPTSANTNVNCGSATLNLLGNDYIAYAFTAASYLNGTRATLKASTASVKPRSASRAANQRR